ncbi:MAG: tetratricopeptide repeat protein [Pseudomonadota bacterium]
MMWWRALVVLTIATLLCLGALRSMAFFAPTDHPLRALRSGFSSHPDAATDQAMTRIGAAAARGEGMPSVALTGLSLVARKAPLAPDPFLVNGTVAQMAGEPARAEALFRAARSRDPRSEGARYFLAERYFQTNRILPGLIEMGALARLSERASKPLVPALVAYARTPGAVSELRRYFALEQGVRDQTLSLLAGDAANAPLVLALMPTGRLPSKASDWPGRLVQSMVAAGDYGGAEAMWRRLSRVANRGLIYNPDFRDLAGPPPFNWSYASANSGVAEPAGGGGLEVIYYGREDLTLASQVVRLPPGRYRLAMRINGPTLPIGLAWTVSCYPGPTTILQLPLGTVSKGSVEGTFAVPAAGCTAQAIQLRGQPTEVAETVQLSITGFTLEPLGAGS